MSHPRLCIVDLHEEIDRAAAEIADQHKSRLRCERGCHECCVDDLTVFEVEAERIRAEFDDLLKTGRAHPVGACAFLDGEGACRIYEARPYVCRTQGLPLRWEEETDDGERVEYRDICPLNEAGEPLESLPSEGLWSIGPFESRLASLDAKGHRVKLRALFRS